jgi:amino acid transporter
MEERKRRSEMGCAAMLLSPIVLLGVFALANASRDSNTRGNTFWIWLLLITATVMFTAGAITWLRNRSNEDEPVK